MAPVCDAKKGLVDALVKTNLKDEQSEFMLKLSYHHQINLLIIDRASSSRLSSQEYDIRATSK
jgi:hypothetical protein